MRNESTLNVDVHTRSLRAADRVKNGNGSLQQTLDVPQTSWWHNYFKWETLTVAGRTVEKGFVISPAIAGILLASLLGMAGWAYKSSTADGRETRDSIIRMETLLNERTQTIKEQQAKFEQKLDSEKRIAELQREIQRDELRNIQTALSRKGIQIPTKE